MSTDVKAPEKSVAVAKAQEFRHRATAISVTMLRDWVGEERAKEAAGRVATSLCAAAASARNPEDFYACTPQSVAKVIAISALTGIMVSTGQGALAYAIPRRPRKNEQPQLQYQLSHRGVAALAKRAGFALVAVPLSYQDEIESDLGGEVTVLNRDFDNPPQTEEELRGVLVTVRSLQLGTLVSRNFVPKSTINKRRDTSDSYLYACKKGNEWAQESDPWHKWYVEMAMKTAMHYAINRGWCVIDDTEAVRALAADVESEIVPRGDDSQPRSKAAMKSIEDLTQEAETDDEASELQAASAGDQ